METVRKILICGREEMVVLTDERERIDAYKNTGICCIGVSSGTDFFPDVEFVTDDPERVSSRLLSLAWHRFHHMPYILFEDRQIQARESLPEDYDALENILRCYPQILDFPMDREWFDAYVRDGYRLTGYGMWTVLLKGPHGMEAAGWAGLGPAKEEFEDRILFLRKAAKPSDCSLELGFVIREDLRRRGIAKKICREAIDYAAGVLGEESLLIRTDRSNTPARKLALSLGFQTFSGSGYSSPKVSADIL